MPNRASQLVFALIVGLLLGTVGTFGHRSLIAVGSLNLHWGIVVATLAAACFLVGLRLYTDSRLVTLIGAIGLLVPIFVFSFQGPGGSVVIVGDTLGRIWDFGPAIIAVIVLTWPKLPARSAAHDVRKLDS